MNHLPDYTAVLVAFNSRDVIGPSIDALKRTNHPPKEIIVVDNVSKDDTVAYLRAEYPDVTLLQETQNRGFGVGNNVGTLHAKTPYVFYVNNDLLVEPDCPTLLLKALVANPTWAVVNPRIYRGWDKPATALYACGSVVNDAGFTLNCDSLAGVTEANCFSGACFMASRDIMREYSFPENFFLYYEEPDIALRLLRDKKEIHVVPEAECYHLESYSSPKGMANGVAFRQFHAIPNRWWLVGRYWPTHSLPWALCMNVLHLVYMALFFIRHRKWSFLSILRKAPQQFFAGRALWRREKPADYQWFSALPHASIGELLGARKRVFAAKD